jgi:hypothetical protein
MKRLCGAAEIELDDPHGYLAPHGGRRGMGEALVHMDTLPLHGISITPKRWFVKRTLTLTPANRLT